MGGMVDGYFRMAQRRRRRKTVNRNGPYRNEDNAKMKAICLSAQV